MHESLENTDCFFFIHYLPEDTVKPRWFRVQVNHIETAILKMNPSTTGDYHVTFLSRHPDDNHLCDDITRWWPEWHAYSLNDENIPVYGLPMLFKQNVSVLTHTVLSTASPFIHYQLPISGQVLTTMTRILKYFSIVSQLALL